MNGIYRPGWESQTYQRYSRAKRAEIAMEVDRQFREKTGVSRQLDPTSSKDLELRRIWLRMTGGISGIGAATMRRRAAAGARVARGYNQAATRVAALIAAITGDGHCAMQH